MKKRIEFIYDRNKDMTQIFIWNGMSLIDKREMPGILSSYTKRKLREEIINEGWE